MAPAVLERSALVERPPIAAAKRDRSTLKRVAALLGTEQHATLRSASGESIDLPESVYLLLRDVVDHLRRGRSVTLVPHHRELTTQEAADILNVSRTYLVRVLDREGIPYRRLGTHRRIKFGDLMAYKARRDAKRRTALDRLTEQADELDLYEATAEPVT
jgi:excisionase family DNA binding protein